MGASTALGTVSVTESPVVTVGGPGCDRAAVGPQAQRVSPSPFWKPGSEARVTVVKPEVQVAVVVGTLVTARPPKLVTAIHWLTLLTGETAPIVIVADDDRVPSASDVAVIVTVGGLGMMPAGEE